MAGCERTRAKRQTPSTMAVFLLPKLSPFSQPFHDLLLPGDVIATGTRPVWVLVGSTADSIYKRPIGSSLASRIGRSTSRKSLNQNG